MATSTTRRRYEVTPESMWERIGDFYALHTWVPAVAALTPLRDRGARRLTLADGAEIVESLVDAGTWFYRYRMDEPGPIPVADYRSDLRVEADGPGACVVEWNARFAARGTTEAAATEVIAGFQHSALDALAEG